MAPTHPTSEFEDRLAARLLDVAVDAGPAEVRGQFRRLVRAVHPDVSVADGCVDLGRLAEAKDRLLARHARQAAHDRAARWSVPVDDRVGRLVDLAC